MYLKSARALKEQNDVLYQPGSLGPDNVYWVFTDITPPSTKKAWQNMTIITPGLYGNEFPKTYGHYHNVNINEIYHVIEGKGILLLQKGYPQVTELVLITLGPGDEVTITPEWGHSLSNVGETPLVTYDNWTSGHTQADYDPIKKAGGMACFLLKGKDKEDQAEIQINSRYGQVPVPKFMTANEFAATSRNSL